MESFQFVYSNWNMVVCVAFQLVGCSQVLHLQGALQWNHTKRAVLKAAYNLQLVFWRADAFGKLARTPDGVTNRIRIFPGYKIEGGKWLYWLLSENRGLHNSNIFHILAQWSSLLGNEIAVLDSVASCNVAHIATHMLNVITWCQCLLKLVGIWETSSGTGNTNNVMALNVSESVRTLGNKFSKDRIL